MYQKVIKRWLDIICCGGAMIFLWPVFLIIAVLIRLHNILMNNIWTLLGYLQFSGNSMIRLVVQVKDKNKKPAFLCDVGFSF